MVWLQLFCIFLTVSTLFGASVPETEMDEDMEVLENMIMRIGDGERVKRATGDRGVSNLDIRDALLQMLKVMRDNNKKIQSNQFDITDTVKGMTGSSGVEKKIDNISTFLLRMNNKIDSLSRGGGGGRTAILETLAQESYDIISLLPTYIDNTRKAIYYVGNDTKTMFKDVETLLGEEDDEVTGKKSLRKALESTETNILTASKELKDIVVESGSMAESLFERVDTGYKELEDEIKGLANVEKVLLDTADSVTDTKNSRMRSKVLPMLRKFF